MNTLLKIIHYFLKVRMQNSIAHHVISLITDVSTIYALCYVIQWDKIHFINKKLKNYNFGFFTFTKSHIANFYFLKNKSVIKDIRIQFFKVNILIFGFWTYIILVTGLFIIELFVKNCLIILNIISFYSLNHVYLLMYEDNV